MADFERPIFIVGCPRSGTSLVRLIVDSHPRIGCGPESHVLLDLVRTEENHRERVGSFGWSEEVWRAKLAGVFTSLHEEFAAGRGKTRWADKTPSYIRIIDFIDASFPDCQVVHVVRNGLDVVASHRKRWGLKRAIRACRKWPVRIAQGRRAGERLGPERYTEIRYEELTSSPEPTLRRLFEFLGEPWDDAVLRFYEADHGVTSGQSERARVRVEAGEKAIHTSRVGAGAKEIGPLLRAYFRIRAGGTMRELGYW